MIQDALERLKVTCDWPGCGEPACYTRTDEDVEILLCAEHGRSELCPRRPYELVWLKMQKRVAAAGRRPAGRTGQ